MTTGPRPIVEPPPAEEACCAACAADMESPPVSGVQATPDQQRLTEAPRVAAAPRHAAAPVVLVVLEPDGRRATSRAAERRVTIAGLVVSAGFLAAAILSTALPESVRHGLWLPVHLALAGAAGTAIGSVLPFFVVTLTGGVPMARALRGMAILLIAGGAVLASLGVVSSNTWVAVAGAAAYLSGLAAVAMTAFWPLRHRTSPRHRLVLTAYAVAIAQVMTGIGIVGLMVAGVTPVVERWGLLKPAHAWLNVFGFLSVTVAATLIHLAPTVAGTRIVPRRSAGVALAGLVAGAPLIALGFALGDDRVVRAGALVEIAGAASLVIHARDVWRDRGTWTTDPAWHRVTSWSLFAAPVWLLITVGLGAGRVLWLGAVPAAWDLGSLAAPLLFGWIAQALIGAWSQLLPAIGPGDLIAHARQRTVLGRSAFGRVIALNLGATLATVGVVLGWPPASGAGMILAAGSIAVSTVNFVRATRIGLDAARPQAPLATTGPA